MIRLILSCAAIVTLAACSGYEEDDPSEVITQSEREALDDAAEMIEQRRLPDDALPPAGDDETTEFTETAR